VVARSQNLHDLHGQHDDSELLRLLFGNNQAKIQFTAPDNHVSDNVIDGVVMNSRTSCNHVAHVASDTPQKLGGTG
jgi:hypothetical protein